MREPLGVREHMDGAPRPLVVHADGLVVGAGGDNAAVGGEPAREADQLLLN